MCIRDRFTVLPGICMVLASLAIIITPLKDRKMEALRASLEKKRNGEEYPIGECESIL